MNRKQENLIYSALGVVLLFAVLVLANLLGNRVLPFRIDLTEDNIHTLSDGTHKILKDGKQKVVVRFYHTQSENKTPRVIALNNYARRVRDILREYGQASDKLSVEYIDAQPDTDEEDAARLDGHRPVPLQNQMVAMMGGEQENIYFGLTINCLDMKETVELDRQREPFLEYDISRAITRVLNPQKKRVGVLTPLPIRRNFNPQGPRNDPGPLVIFQKLEQDYDIQSIPMDTTSLKVRSGPKDDEGIDLLLVIHPIAVRDMSNLPPQLRNLPPQQLAQMAGPPQPLSASTQYAIDQYILQGGRAVVFLDPMSVGALSLPGVQEQLTASSMETLLQAWGVRYDQDKFIIDQLGSAAAGGRLPPWAINLSDDLIDKDHPATGDISSGMLLAFSGAFFTDTFAKGQETSLPKKTVLLRSSKNAQLIDGKSMRSARMGQIPLREAVQNYKADGKEYELAIQLQGTFRTAFPEGNPTAAEPMPSATNAPPVSPKKNSNHLDRGTKEGTVVLVADADLLANNFAFEMARTLDGRTIFMPANGNISFLLNIVDLMAGDANLIGTRSRAVQRRPFKLFDEKEKKAQEDRQKEIKNLQEKAQEIVDKINKIERARAPQTQSQGMLSDESAKELEKLRTEQAANSKRMREVDKDLRKEIDSLKSSLQLWTIGGMPVLVALVGLGLAVWRRTRTSAQ